MTIGAREVGLVLQEVQTIFRTAMVYTVGGVPRDLLLGKEVRDIDLAVLPTSGGYVESETELTDGLRAMGYSIRTVDSDRYPEEIRQLQYVVRAVSSRGIEVDILVYREHVQLWQVLDNFPAAISRCWAYSSWLAALSISTRADFDQAAATKVVECKPREDGSYNVEYLQKLEQKFPEYTFNYPKPELVCPVAIDPYGDIHFD